MSLENQLVALLIGVALFAATSVIATLWGFCWKKDAEEFESDLELARQLRNQRWEEFRELQDKYGKVLKDNDVWIERYAAACNQHKLLDNCPEIVALRGLNKSLEEALAKASAELKNMTEACESAEEDLADLEDKIKFAQALYRPVAVRGPKGDTGATGAQGPSGRDAIGT
jgi:hypothetical protein